MIRFMYRKFRHVVVAGTFDKLHKGHEAVLTRAFTEGERVTVGLTTDAFVRRYKLDKLAQLDKLDIKQCAARKKALELWLAAQNYAGRATIIPLNDPYGFVVPQSTHDVAGPDVEAIVVSTETRPRAEDINQLRREAGWKPLAIVEVPMVQAEDLAAISSTRVRAREIDQEGKLIMPDNLRPELQRPLGRVLRGSDVERSVKSKQGSMVITVGDVATKTLLDMGIVPHLAIIDGKVGRKPFHETLKILQLQKVKPFSLKPVKSGPGYISKKAIQVLRSRIRLCRTTLARPVAQERYWVLVVDGEEDLLALPAIAEAPLGAVVYYGQPNRGLVEVVVDMKKRARAVALLSEFEALTK